MQPLEPGSFDVSGVFFSLSAAVLAKRKPYEGPQYPTRNTSAALSKPAPAPVRIAPASTPASTSLSAASLAADQPDTCSLAFQQSLWRTPSGEPWQGTESASKPARPGLSLAALEKLRS